MTRPLYMLLFGVATTLGLLVVFQIAQRLLGKGRTVKADLERGNSARALLQVGHVLAIFLVAGSSVASSVEGESLSRDILWVASFGCASVLLLEVCGRLGIGLLVRQKLPLEIERGNVAAGVAAGSHFVATGILVARAVGGSDLRGLGLSLVFFLISLVTLHLFVILFRALTVYDDAEEILGGNLAAALSYAGITIALALLIGRAVEGPFLGWAASLKGYGEALLLCLALYPVRQFVVQTLLLGGGFTLRSGRLDVGVAQERNVGMGALEAVGYLATAFLVLRLG